MLVFNKTRNGPCSSDQRRHYDLGLAIGAKTLDAASRYISAMALEDCYAPLHE